MVCTYEYVDVRTRVRIMVEQSEMKFVVKNWKLNNRPKKKKTITAEAAAQNNARYRPMVTQKNIQKRLKAKNNNCLQVRPVHYLSTICFLANRVARGVNIWLDSRVYPFLTPNGPGIPVFGYCPFSYQGYSVFYKKLKNVSCEYDRLNG